jgi:hypothetical protein
VDTACNISIIEELRCEMIRMAEQKGTLCDPDVVAISQRLDEWIFHAQNSMLH